MTLDAGHVLVGLALVGLALLGSCAAFGDDPPATAPASPPDLTRDPTLYVVGYAHLDSQWRWSYPQVLREMIPATLRDNFALIERYPSYVFNFSGAARYLWMKEYYPADFAKLKEYVAKGRWFPCGSSLEESDAIVPSAESLIRHVLYGNQFFRREFGRSSTEYMLPDCFGFPASLPSILAHCGIEGFSTQKLTWGSAMGIPFNVGIWEGPDGGCVIAALNPGEYVGKVVENLSQSEKWQKRIKATGEKAGLFVDYHYYGTGDTGGAPLEASVRKVEESTRGPGPTRVISGAADRMFADLRGMDLSKLPRYKGELLLTEHSAGSITSQAYMKRWNRMNELLADAAERASVAAAWLGGTPYPHERLFEAWVKIARNQFHDNLPGTSVPKAYEFCWNDATIAMNTLAGTLEHAVNDVAGALDTRGEGVAVVIYNPLAIEREDVVEAAIRLPGPSTQFVKVTGPDGRETPWQINGIDGDVTRLLILAKAPPVGFAVYHVEPLTGPVRVSGHVDIDERGLSNPRYEIKLNDAGDVASIVDRANHRELLASPHRLVLLHEKPANWPAWNMDWANRQKPPVGFVEGPASVRIVEHGPVRAALEVTRQAGDSTFVQTIRLAAGDAGNRIEMANRIDWKTRECVLKADFPLAVSNPRAVYNWDVGTVERGNNDPRKYEVPAHQWISMTDARGDYGVTILTGSKYGSDKPADNQLRLTLLYTPGVRGEYQDQATQDWGRHEILYGLVGHKGGRAAADADWHAWRMEQPLLAFQAPSHEGPLGKLFSLVRVENPRVRVLALKRAEESDEVIVRLVELDGQPQKAVRVAFAAPVVSAREVNGQEQPLSEPAAPGAGPATPGVALLDGALVVDFTPFKLRSFAVKLAPPPAKATPMATQPIDLPFNICVTNRDGTSVNGGFDHEGRCLPGEVLPDEIDYGPIKFTMGPRAGGLPNAVACRGQSIALPQGDFSRLYLLAAADGDQEAVFEVDGRQTRLLVQDWTGFVGQWDNRVWGGEVREMAFAWYNECLGLRPAYVKPAPIAWTSTQRHSPTGQSEPYAYSYLFAYALDLPPGARSLKLPNNERVRVLAATAASHPAGLVRPLQPLVDTLERDDVLRTRITPAGGAFDETLSVTIEPVLWGTADGIRYTLDGSEPKADSFAYKGPFRLSSPTRVRARLFDAHGNAGEVTDAQIDVDDKTPPRVVQTLTSSLMPLAFVRFSEDLDPVSAADANHYQLDGLGVISAMLAPDGREVRLTLDRAPDASRGTLALTVAGVRDLAPRRNAIEPAVRVDVPCAAPLLTVASAKPDGRGDPVQLELPGDAPVRGASAWTINFWLKADEQPVDYTVIAGVGSCEDTGGTQRYFAKFPHGLHFWGSRIDVAANAPLRVGEWQMVTATYDGKLLTLYHDGRPVATREITLADAAPLVQLGPTPPWGWGHRFRGELSAFTVWSEALPPALVATLHERGAQ